MGYMLEVEPRNATDDTLIDGGLGQGEQSPEVATDPPVRKSSRYYLPFIRYPSSEYVVLTLSLIHI